MSPDWISRLRDIRRDHRAGASALVGRAIDASRVFLAATRGLAPDRLRPLLARFTRRLVARQPSMAPFLILANAMWRSADRPSGLTWEDLHTAVAAHAARVDRRLLKTIRHGARLVRSGSVILTYSHSTAVRMALLGALAAGRRFTVVCSESRPMGEGTALARRLAAAGISVHLTTDAALATWTERADLVLVGADAVLGSGVVNKVGTASLLWAARRAGVPAYVLADSGKWLPPALAAFWRTREERPDEIARPGRASLQVHNSYFDCSPPRLITGVVWEEGIAAPPEVRRRIAGLPTSRGLIALLQGHEARRPR